MNRKISYPLLIIGLLMAVSVSDAQQVKKIPRIGYLSGGEPVRDSVRAESIRQGLRNLGYIDGQNIRIEYRYSENDRKRHAVNATELVRLKVAVIIVAGGNNLIEAAMDATKTIPIVLVGQGSDPVEAGYVKSLAHPGGNVTGLTVLNRDLGGKRLELLKEVVPGLTRVAVFDDPATPGTVRELKEVLPIAARALGLTIHPWEVRDANAFDRVFAALSKERFGGLYVMLAGEIMGANRKRIADFALKGRLPSVYDNSGGVEVGGLMSHAADRLDSYRRVAVYVDKI